MFINIDTCKDLFYYINLVYITNINLIKLCGSDLFLNMIKSRELLYEVIEDFTKIIPLLFENNGNILVLAKNDGIMFFSNEIDYIENYCEKILNDNYVILFNIKKVRNKLEHQRHIVTYNRYSTGNSNLFEYTFIINNNEYEINADDLIKLMTDINSFYRKLFHDVDYNLYKANNNWFKYTDKTYKYDFEAFSNFLNGDRRILRFIGRHFLDL